MAEPAGLQPLVSHLANEDRIQGDPRRVPPGRPTAGPARGPALAEALASLQLAQPFQKCAPFGRLERGGVAHVVEDAVVAVEAEQQRADTIALLRQPVPAHDAVGVA